MSADSTCQDTDYARHIQEILDELGQLQQTPQLMTSPEDLEALEHEIRQRTDHLGSLLVGYHLQGRVLAGCGYCFGISPKRSERGQSAGHHHSKPVFTLLCGRNCQALLSAFLFFLVSIASDRKSVV